MTKAESYIDCRKQGMTYQAIANLYGVKRQTVHRAIKNHNNRSIHVKPQTVVFPRLRNWMCENHVFVKDLEDRTGMYLRTALSSGRISDAKVEAILNVTKLSYDDAFGR